MNSFNRPLAIAVLVVLASVVSAKAVSGAPRATPAPSASPTAPAALPTATPEPPETAIPRLEAKIKANPNDHDALEQLAGYYLSAGRPDRALPLTQHLIALGDKGAQTLYLDGISNQELGRVREAITDFEQASNLEPTNAQLLTSLTSLYLRVNRMQDAERVAKRATTFNPNDKRVFENYGLALSAEKKYDEARQAFEQAAKLDPKDPDPLVLEARSYVDQNAIALALQEFDRAIAVDPKDVEALLGKARLLAAEHNVKDSIATYETTLALVPSDVGKAQLLIEEMRVYQNEKMTAEMAATMKRALSQYGSVPDVHLANGDYLISTKDEAGAEAEWKVALGPKRDNAEALQRLGDLALHQKKVGQALDYFRRLGEVQPNNAEVFGELGQVEALAGHQDRARDAYRRAFELSRDPSALAGIMGADYQLRNYKECTQIADAFDKGAAAFIKQNPELLYVMGKCYSAGGQREKALGAYKRFLPYLRPRSPTAKDVQKQIDSLSVKPTAKPTAKPKSK